jgi:fermentation-respiration switch protein FrsA (DUF1100 family)
MSPSFFLKELAATFFEDLTCAFSLKNWKDISARVLKLSKKQILRNALIIVPQLMFFYCLLSPVVAMPLYDKMLFFPAQVFAAEYDTISGTAKEDVTIASANNAQLHGWYYRVANARGTVIISHGNAGNISYRIPLIRMLIHEKLSVLAYDYQGYGKSTGTPTIDNVCRDGLAAYDFLTKQRNVDPAKIIVYGESLGGGIASYTAANRKVGGIILQSTFSSLPHIARKRMALMRFYPDFLFPKNKLDSAKLLEDEHAPLLIVHGRIDSIIPVEEAEVIFKRASAPKKLVIIDNANHNDVYGSPNEIELNTAVSKFIDSVL